MKGFTVILDHILQWHKKTQSTISHLKCTSPLDVENISRYTSLLHEKPLILGTIKKEEPKISMKESTGVLLNLLQTAPVRVVQQEQIVPGKTKLIVLPMKGKNK